MTTRPFLFGTNFKMNQTADESAVFYDELARMVTPRDGVRLFIIPPFTSLPAVTARRVENPCPLWVGAQNMHWAADGAYTGEISAAMLTALGIDLVLLGHAERRGQFFETDEALAKKVETAFTAGLRVLLCVGETAQEKGFGVGAETVARQLKIALHEVATGDVPRLQIAYEPVWSIGAGGTPASPEEVAPIAAHLRATLGDLFGEAGRAVPILYGGSVSPENAGTFTALPDIDGLFVGRSAWTVEGYVNVMEAGLAGREATGNR